MGRAFDLLIVDDDPGQLRLVERLLSELSLPHRCHYAPSGKVALDFLRRLKSFENAPRPNLVLLDLNMPGMNGCEVLQQIKTDPELCAIPVLMLSSSIALKDVDACYREHANAYLQKPADLDGNLALLRDIDRFWGGCAVVPD